MRLAIINLITRTNLLRHKAPAVPSNKEAMIVKFAAALKVRGIDPDVYVADAYKPAQDERLPVTVKYLPTRLQQIFWPSRTPFTPSLSRELKDNYDVVLCGECFQWSTVLAILAKIRSTKRPMKIIVWQELAKHSRIFGKIPSILYYHIILRFFLDRHISGYIPRGALAREFLLREGISDRKILPTVSHGYDPVYFSYEAGIKKENYIFSPSRLVADKGIDVLLKAFALASANISGIRLVIQGEGPLLDEYRDLARQLNIEDRVSFDTQRLNHHAMRERYQKALLTVISARADNIIFSDMESIACGTPVVLSTGVDSHVNYLDGKGGTFFRSEEPQALADTLAGILNDRARLFEMEEEALEKAKRFTNQFIGDQILTIIRTITHEHQDAFVPAVEGKSR